MDATGRPSTPMITDVTFRASRVVVTTTWDTPSGVPGRVCQGSGQAAERTLRAARVGEPAPRRVGHPGGRQHRKTGGRGGPARLGAHAQHTDVRHGHEERRAGDGDDGDHEAVDRATLAEHQPGCRCQRDGPHAGRRRRQVPGVSQHPLPGRREERDQPDTEKHPDCRNEAEQQPLRCLPFPHRRPSLVPPDLTGRPRAERHDETRRGPLRPRRPHQRHHHEAAGDHHDPRQPRRLGATGRIDHQEPEPGHHRERHQYGLLLRNGCHPLGRQHAEYRDQRDLGPRWTGEPSPSP